MTFGELKFHHDNDGMHAIVKFPNGYGASVIKTRHSYGHEQGLYELAVLIGNELCYDSGLTADVVGYLNEHEVEDWLEKIEGLEKP